MSQIELNGIKKIYGKGTNNEVEALKGVSFGIEKGQFVVILGASGAGKSTLLNILGGMDLATEGEYLVEGNNVTKYNAKELGIFRRKKIGFVFQFYNLMPNLTTLENVRIAETVADDPLDSKEILEMVGLSGRDRNFPSQLSGGEQQRVAIARAIVKNPTLLLCDEPTGALDSKTGGKIIKLLRDVCKDYNMTVVIVTHNSKIAEVADRVIEIQDGQIFSDKLNDDIKEPGSIVW